MRRPSRPPLPTIARLTSLALVLGHMPPGGAVSAATKPAVVRHAAADDSGLRLVLSMRLERLPGERAASLAPVGGGMAGAGLVAAAPAAPADGATAAVPSGSAPGDEPALALRPMVVLPPRGTGGKLLLTGGVSQVEGAAGGGLVPWAVVGGYGAAGQWGANVHATRVRTGAFALDTYGVTVGVNDRLELSLARQSFDTRAAGAALGLGAGFKFEQDIAGAKVRLLGDAVLDADRWMPQVSAGVQTKHNRQGAVVRSVGAHSDSGTDFYLSGTKLLLAPGVLLNGTVRWTKANQFGLLGFGGDRNDRYRPQAELSAAYLLSRHWAVGGEFRTKPDNLRFAREQDAWDAFVAWAPTKNVSLTLAYVALGDIATVRNQRGWYFSAQTGF
ncbi:DUF3034 family protein [Xylophilus ampelinus]|uniref:DUF3034 family protein n=1 Tax=Xylophilus ampelinus TaxID=54067 RepID=UPI001F3CF6E4|nr:DUF3034 family protein [Xylophilus ampelinus]MCS4511294.1 DUF3034 family protein [Xylophilus ampelinus]